uniref:Uncharacterized protein n=1 Tax=viral metagenome TaxID=1070528 RepID=A0A6C0K2K7_9ZZZZ
MDQDIDDFDVDFLDDPDAFNPNVFDSQDEMDDDFDPDALDDIDSNPDPDAFNPNVFDSQDEMDDDFDPEDKMDDFDLDALDVNDVMEL